MSLTPVVSASFVSTVGGRAYPERVNRPRRKPQPSFSNRPARIRLLNAELDESRHSAVERTRTTDTKASFLVVAAGLLGGAASLELVNADTRFFGLFPLGFTLATVVAAAAALWPRALKVPSAPHIVDCYVDADITADELEDHLLEVKKREVENRNAQNETKAELTSWGFVFLIVSMATAFGVVIFGAVV